MPSKKFEGIIPIPLGGDLTVDTIPIKLTAKKTTAKTPVGKKTTPAISQFTSPQTMSKYKILYTGDKVSIVVRGIEPGMTRVRIQGEEAILKKVSSFLKFPKDWGGIKDDDHLSIAVPTDSVANAIADAVQASFMVDITK